MLILGFGASYIATNHFYSNFVPNEEFARIKFGIVYQTSKVVFVCLTFSAQITIPLILVRVCAKLSPLFLGPLVKGIFCVTLPSFNFFMALLVYQDNNMALFRTMI